MADADQGNAGGADAVDLGKLGRVELELDEELGHGEAELRPVVEVGLAVVGVLHRPHERAAGAGEDAAKARAGLICGEQVAPRGARDLLRGVNDAREVLLREELAATSGSPCARSALVRPGWAGNLPSARGTVGELALGPDGQ